MPEVFELTIEPGRRAASTRASSCCLMSSRSTIASMIQSTSARRDMPSSKPPVVTSRCTSGVNCGSGLSRRAFSRPSLAASGVRSSSSDGNAGVGAVQRDLRAHGAGAEDGNGADRHSRWRRLLRPVGRSLAPTPPTNSRPPLGLGCERVAAAAQHPVGRHFVERAEEDLGGDRRVHVARGTHPVPGRRRWSRESGRGSRAGRWTRTAP